MVSSLHFVIPPTTLVSVNLESNITSSNWSGYINTSNEQIYNTAQAYWTEPTLQASRCSQNSATFWAGLGRFNSKQLAQDGTALNVPGFGEHQAWSEVLPTQSSMVAANLYTTPGAQFVSSVTYEGNNNFSFYMYNFATGQATSFVVNAYGCDGSTAEYIAERPTTNGTIDNLSNFGTIDFISAETNGNSIGTYGHSAITMTDGNTTLAIPSALYGGSSFSVTQHACN